MKNKKLNIVFPLLMVAALTGCSQMTVLRTQEMKAVGSEVEMRLDSVAAQLAQQNDSLRAELDSTKALLEASSLAQKRMQAEGGACEAKLEIAKVAKKLNLDAIHDTVHEMAKDEARHGAGFQGLFNKYFKK